MQKDSFFGIEEEDVSIHFMINRVALVTDVAVFQGAPSMYSSISPHNSLDEHYNELVRDERS
jgi:hypothetical protein